MRTEAPVDLRGHCARRFEAVQATFEENFRLHGEIGASVCVTYDGEVVVDLVGGVADPGSGTPWTSETIVMVWSCTKGALAMCVHGLVGLGQLDLDAPVSRYWPAFRHGERQNVSVAMLLNHQAGLPGVSEPLPPGAVFDWEEMTARVACEAPWWEPGTRHGYHSFTYGWLVGEIVRRVTSQLPGDFFRDHVAGPLGLDFHIGLPQSEDHRVARVVMARPEDGPRSPFRRAVARREPMQLAVLNSMGEFAEPDVCERRTARAATVPAVNGIGNARGLALLYMPAALGDLLGDLPLRPASLLRMRAVESACGRDAVTRTPTRFSSGFQKATLARDGWDVFAISEEAFGHVGFGNSFGFADPARRISMGYAMNRHAAPGDNVRHQSLIDAAYRSLACG
jgi:CubicO group peptidase (beta-lactamase class C family)